MAKQGINPLSSININGSCLYSGATSSVCIYTNAQECQDRYKGIFFEGLTCSVAVGLSGACCLWDSENKTLLPCQTSTYAECYTLAKSFNFRFHWSVGSCKDKKCESVFQSKARTRPVVGACCNGNGLCKETTQDDCETNSLFYQGDGTICSNGICIEGTGGCCDGVTCNDGITGTTCIENKKLYFGKQKRCWEYQCQTEYISCLDSIPTEKLKVGDVLEGGVVIGVYSPGYSKGWGPKYLTPQTELNLLLSDTLNSGEFTTIPDGRGYGTINSDELCDNPRYIMIVSMHPVSNETTKTRYTWSRDSNSWGPLFTSWGKIIEQNTIGLNERNEGFLYNTNFSENANNNIIRDNLIKYCDKRRENDPISNLEIRSTHGLFGRWSLDWGLYNTIRMVNAALFHTVGTEYDSYLNKQLYDSGPEYDSTSMVDIATQIIKYNIASSKQYSYTSDWFVPAANQWAFILNEIRANRLNETLIGAGASPIIDVNWTSTGAFDYKNNEGKSNGTTCSRGTTALAINSNTLTFELRNRMNPAGLRPIRLIPCNAKIPTSDYSVLWRINT